MINLEKEIKDLREYNSDENILRNNMKDVMEIITYVSVAERYISMAKNKIEEFPLKKGEMFILSRSIDNIYDFLKGYNEKEVQKEIMKIKGDK